MNKELVKAIELYFKRFSDSYISRYEKKDYYCLSKNSIKKKGVLE